MSLPELPVWPGTDRIDRRAPSSASTLPQRVVFVLACAVGGAVLALPAGWLWTVLADSPEGVVFDGSVFYDEAQLNIESGVTLWFLVVGVVLGVASGLVVGLLGHRHGVVTVLAVLVLSLVAAVLTGVIGVHIFGPDEAAQLRVAEDGEAVSAALDVATWVGYLGWPVGGLVGLLAAIAGWPHDTSRRTPPDAT